MAADTIDQMKRHLSEALVKTARLGAKMEWEEAKGLLMAGIALVSLHPDSGSMINLETVRNIEKSHVLS